MEVKRLNLPGGGYITNSHDVLARLTGTYLKNSGGTTYRSHEYAYTRGTDLSGSLEGAGGIGGLLARSEGSTQASYFADGNGNITSLSGGNLAVVASYRYDPYGNLLFKSGAWADTNVYRFSSKECHVKSGLYYYLYRWYSPELQRWITRDPVDERGFDLLFRGFLMFRRGNLDVDGDLVPDRNLYLYTANSPNSFMDPDGRSIKSACELCYVTPAMADAIYDYKAAVERLNAKYGDDWPTRIEEYVDNWLKDLIKNFGRCVADPIMRTTPGSSMTGPVVRPKRL